jgi:hypothetical protein
MKTRYPDLFAIDGTASRFLGELYENTQYERTTRLESAWALFSDYSGGGWLARFPAGINPSDMSAVTAATERTYGSCGGLSRSGSFSFPSKTLLLPCPPMTRKESREFCSKNQRRHGVLGVSPLRFRKPFSPSSWAVQGKRQSLAESQEHQYRQTRRRPLVLSVLILFSRPVAFRSS